MEIASEELISDEEREYSRNALKKYCEEAFLSVSEEESKTTARAVYHDAVSSAAKNVANTLAEESVPIACGIIEDLLKNAKQYPFVEEAVLMAVKPVARDEALAQVRIWSQEKALPRAEDAARKIYLEQLNNGSPAHLQTATLAAVRVLIQNQINQNPETSKAEREKIIEDYYKTEARATAADIYRKEIGPELRRKAQTAAQNAVHEIASQASDELAREAALAAAKAVASDTAKMEISRLILAESQRRAAKMAREQLQDEVQKIEEDKKLEFCLAEAAKIADQAVASVCDEIAEPEKAGLEKEKARELALSAASAVAREFAGCYQLDCEYDIEPTGVSRKTIVLLVLQVMLGALIVWFFLLGGFETCQPFLKTVLPAGLYEAIYRSVPPLRPGQNENDNDGSNKESELDDLLDEAKTESNPADTERSKEDVGPPKEDVGPPKEGAQVPKQNTESPETNPALPAQLHEGKSGPEPLKPEDTPAEIVAPEGTGEAGKH